MSQPTQSLTAPEITTTRHDAPYMPIMNVYCFRCKKEQSGPIQKYKTGSGTYLCCLIWCCIAIIPGLIPFCCDRCKDKVYSCPECQTVVQKQPYEPCNCE